MRVCTVTLGECDAGLLMTTTTDQSKRDSYRAFVIETFHSWAIEITVSTASVYAEVMSRIWRKHPPPPGRQTEAHLLGLGVDINDVWVFSVAYEHGLTLLTTDRMDVLKECVPEVKTDNWTT